MVVGQVPRGCTRINVHICVELYVYMYILRVYVQELAGTYGCMHTNVYALMQAKYTQQELSFPTI